MYLFVDESIHDNHGFLLLAYVMCRANPQQELDALLRRHGAVEHHSLTRMAHNARAQQLRAELKAYLLSAGVQWAVHVFPAAARYGVAVEMWSALRNLAGSLPSQCLSAVVLDEGLVSAQALSALAPQDGVPHPTIEKSHVAHGIQLADLVAALCGVRLREEVSGQPKLLSYGAEAGYEPPIQAELGFELWADLRYSMRSHDAPRGADMPDMATFETEGAGLFVSPQCTSELQTAARKLFGHVYLGCIH